MFITTIVILISGFFVLNSLKDFLNDNFIIKGN